MGREWDRKRKLDELLLNNDLTAEQRVSYESQRERMKGLLKVKAARHKLNKLKNSVVVNRQAASSDAVVATVLSTPSPQSVKAVSNHETLVSNTVSLQNICATSSTSNMKRISVVGDIFFDIVAKDIMVLPSRWSTDTLASSIQQIPGGSALNCSMHASNYLEYKCNTNIKVAVFSAVGDDIAGHTCKDTLKSKGSIEDKVVVKETLRTGSCIVISGDNERCFITDRGCVNDLAIDWFSSSDILATDLIHITGYYNCSGLHAGIVGLLSEACSRGILTSFNPQYDATGQWGGVQSLCPFLDIIVCNEDELKYMTTGTIESTDFEVLHYVDILFNWGCRNSVVVTMGGKGAAVFCKDKQSSSPSISVIHEKPPMVNVVDSTGAGDAFAGAMLVEYVWTADWKRSLHAGVLASSAAVMSVGGSSCSQQNLATVDALSLPTES